MGEDGMSRNSKECRQASLLHWESYSTAMAMATYRFHWVPQGRMYLLVVDAYGKVPEVSEMLSIVINSRGTYTLWPIHLVQ